MKTCPNCGVPVEEGQRFCGECGAQLNLPREPVYTEDERRKKDPALNKAVPGPTPKKEEKVPELTLEPDLWGSGSAAAAAAPVPEPKQADKMPELTLEPDSLKKSSAAAAASAAASAASAAADQTPPPTEEIRDEDTALTSGTDDKAKVNDEPASTVIPLAGIFGIAAAVVVAIGAIAFVIARRRQDRY